MPVSKSPRLSKPSTQQKVQATSVHTNYYEKEYPLTFTMRELMLMQDAISDNVVTWRREVKRRKATATSAKPEPYERLEEKLQRLETINEDLKDIIRTSR